MGSRRRHKRKVTFRSGTASTPKSPKRGLTLWHLWFAMAPLNVEAITLAAEYDDIVRRLKTARERRNMTQPDLDDAIGLTRGHVEKLENRTRIARGDLLLLWANALGLKFTMGLRDPVATRPKTGNAG